jgi:hypothetical protein
MPTLEMLSGDQTRALAHRLLTVGPLLRKVPPERVLAELGWPQLPGGTQTAIFGDNGLGLGRTAVSIAPDGSAKAVSAPVHSDLPRPITEPVRDFRQDAFSMAGRALIAEFGEPTALVSGGHPTMRWRRGPSLLTLSRSPLGVSMVVWRASDLEGPR